jgi:hypothetical protein
VLAAIAGLGDKDKCKEDAFSNYINGMNNDVHLLELSEDYWKAAIID